MGILGKGGEYKPRFGLWLDTSPECEQAVKGLLAEGFNCDVVLKWSIGERQVVSLADYQARLDEAGQLEPLECEPSLYVREVFFPERFNLRRRVA